MVENALWDFGMVTDAGIPCNQPDLVVFLKQDRRILSLEVSCLTDVNVIKKEKEKVGKYQALAGELAYHEQPVDVIPVVFGHSGDVSCQQQHYLKRIPLFSESLFHNLQKAALLGIVSILRNVNLSATTTTSSSSSSSSSSPYTLMCRLQLCSQQEETIQHLLAGCPMLAPSRYLSHHVALVLHWHLCSTFGLPIAVSWHSHEPLPVVENRQIKILWDFGIHMLAAIGSNHPGRSRALLT